jgi:hypothetical protein
VTKKDLDSSLKSFLKKLQTRFGKPERPPTPDDPIEELIWAYLLWESTETKALHAFKRIKASVVDFNELRVTLPVEIAAVLGERYPLAEERSVRLRASLDDVFRSEHSVSLMALKQLSKREAKQRLESIHAIPPFVVSRVLLMGLGGHATPIDQMMLDRMIDEGLLDDKISVDEANTMLPRHIKAADAVDAHLLLRQWAESPPAKERKSPSPKKKTTAKTAKKATRKKAVR